MSTANIGALGKVCAACGTARKTKNLRYDVTDFKGYCDNPFTCNENHPNTPANILRRNAELKLLPLNEAERFYREQLLVGNVDADKIAKIRRLVEHPTTVRVQDPDLAIFLINLQDELDLNSMSDTIRYACYQLKENMDGMYNKKEQVRQEIVKKHQDAETVKNIEQSIAAPTPAPVQPAPGPFPVAPAVSIPAGAMPFMSPAPGPITVTQPEAQPAQPSTTVQPVPAGGSFGSF